MVEIKSINKHYEVYKDGEFWCSADTRHEAEQDKEEAEAENENGEQNPHSMKIKKWRM